MRFALLAITASFGGMLFGYDTDVVSGALLYVRQAFHLTGTMQGLVTAIALAGAALGSLAAGSLSDRFGRRIIILGAACLFIAGALITSVAFDFIMLLGGRFVVGAGIGIASMLTPLYLSELAPKDRRGGVVTLNQMFLTIGILIAYLIGNILAVQERYGGRETFRPTRLTLEQSAFHDTLTAEVGWQDTEHAFAASPEYWGHQIYCDFQSVAFCGTPQGMVKDSGYVYYPVAAPGAWVKGTFLPGLSLKVLGGQPHAAGLQ